ncbi:hypothetical protein KGM_215427 [Danaus plexippus plexippus]|uniref:Uncharacterized protein n=1 Tax=Danaus plexippus plexippus TaxID=278856 RepID=A0A212EZ11_DANPL|nr:hypothetical protein KGM_215427 [Danaus plexippus plexippus]
MLHMAKKILPTRPKKINHTSILKSDTKVREIVLTQEVQQKVIDFFEQDDVSRMCPSKRDSVKHNGIKKQRRVLLHTVKNLVSKFVKETGIVLSYSTLLRAKPFWVVAPKARDRETCLCVKHANFEEKLNAKELKHASIEEFIKQYTCDVKSHDCMNSLCEKCKIPEFELGDNRDSLTYFTWNEPGHGKGPMDGVGGSLKRTADRHVLMGNDVRTASEFADLFKIAAIDVKVIPEEDVIE